MLIEQATAGSLSALRPPPGAWRRACRGTRWWTERRQPHGWRCMRCLPPDHLPSEAIRRESEADDAPRGLDRGADPLFRQAGLDLDEG
jgi:hypothetical protein